MGKRRVSCGRNGARRVRAPKKDSDSSQRQCDAPPRRGSHVSATWGSPTAATARASTPSPGTKTMASALQTTGPARADAAMPAPWNCSLRLRGGRAGPAWKRSPGRRARTTSVRCQRGRHAAARDGFDAKRTAPGGDLVQAGATQVDRQRLGSVDRVRRACANRRGDRGSCAVRRRRPASAVRRRPALPRAGARPASPARARRARAQASDAAPTAGAARAVPATPPRSRSAPATVVARSATAIASIASAACCAQRAALASATSASRKRREQRRPDPAPHAVARQANVVVALVVEPAQPMRAHVGLDRLARRLEPRSRPADAVAPRQRGHRRERGDAAAAQRLKQKGLGLVASMVAQKDEVDAMLQRHPAQGAIARLARPRLDAVAGLRSLRDPLGRELDRLAAMRPAPTAIGAMGQPRVGVGAQSVMDVQCEDRDAERRGRSQGRVQQRGRIAPAAVGDGDPMRPGFGVSAPWCR